MSRCLDDSPIKMDLWQEDKTLKGSRAAISKEGRGTVQLDKGLLLRAFGKLVLDCFSMKLLLPGAPRRGKNTVAHCPPGTKLRLMRHPSNVCCFLLVSELPCYLHWTLS